MASAILIPGFLNHASTFGFRIGNTQIPGADDVEHFLSDPRRILTPEEASPYAAFKRLCGGCRPFVPVLLASKPAPSTATANERILEGFSFLLEVLFDSLEEDLEAAMRLLEMGSIPVALHYPPDYDTVCLAFEDAVTQARNESRLTTPKTVTALFLDMLEAFTGAVNSNNPMNLLTWSLKALVHLPSGWDLPAVILQLLTALVEWKMLLFAPAADTLKDIAHQMKGIQGDQHNWEIEARLHYLAGTALLVTSFSEMKDAFGEAIDEFQGALLSFEQTQMAGPELHRKFSLCFATIGEILESRGRHDEANAAFKLAERERKNAT